jgi:hypothetical protein
LGFALQNNQLDRIKKARDKSEEVQMKWPARVAIPDKRWLIMHTA